MNPQTITHHGITFDRIALEEFCRKNGIKKLSLFGSVLTDNFGSDSDIDMLVEFIPGETVTFITLSRMERNLSVLFDGRKVDLRTPHELSRYFRDRVETEAETLYVR